MNRKHILLVDDDLNLLRSLEFILEAADFRVTTETNGQKALEKAISAGNDKISPIDLLITDIQMPGLTGLQLIDELHRMKLSMPVLVITAYSDSKLKKELSRRGCPYCLDKPFYEEKLIQEVFRILGRNMNWAGNIYQREGEMERTAPVPAMKTVTMPAETPTDMAFLELVNRRLDHVKAYNSGRHYGDHVYLARKWIKEWDGLSCADISQDRIQGYLLKRARVSAFTANKDLRYLRALFNHGVGRNWITDNPTKGIPFFPVEKRLKYVPPKEDVLRVIGAADPGTQDYLWTIKETMARMGEINRLTWTDVNLDERYVVLYTRKKKGGHLTPRKVPMTQKLFEILSRRYEERDEGKPWVFWQRYWDRKKKEWVEGPYQDRKKFMKTLCNKVGVRYFRFHALRHLGASTLDLANVNLGSIQRILGHENRKTTEIYLHSIGEAEREAMKVFEQVG